MSLRYYSSTDSGAPVLSGLPGSFINLLDTLLDGSGIAYGSKLKAGWSKVFSGTDKAVYLTADGVGYYRVQHDGAQGAASTREAVVRGASGATDVDTLVNPFPTVAQVADSACVWRVSDVTTSAARVWNAVATDNFIAIEIDSSASSGWDMYVMGRYAAVDASNIWNHLVSTRAIANNPTESQAASMGIRDPRGTYNASKLFLMRSPLTLNWGVRGVVSTAYANSGSSAGSSLSAGEDAIPGADGTIRCFAPELWANGNGTITVSSAAHVGYIPHLWALRHGGFGTAVRRDVFSAPQLSSGAVLQLWGASGSGTTLSRVAVEITDTWVSPI